MDEPKIRNMEDFATVSGISRPTVSKYFNDPQSVRESTRQRIEAALEKFDYRPNMYAVNQNRRLTKNVGIVIPYMSWCPTSPTPSSPRSPATSRTW